MLKVSMLGKDSLGQALKNQLLKHPQVDPVYLDEITFPVPDLASLQESLKTTQLLFTLPHTPHLPEIAALCVALGVKLIDFSPLFSLDHIGGEKGLQEKGARLLAHRGYGLPELFRNDFKNKTLIANPHPFEMGALLPLGPLLKYSRLLPHTTTIEAFSSLSPSHSPLPLLHQSVYDLSGVREPLHFQAVYTNSPYVTTKVVVTPTPHLSLFELHGYLLRYYLNEPFVRLLPLGECIKDHPTPPKDSCLIVLEEDASKNQIVMTSLLDPLEKGSVSQGVQNMNLLFGLSETLSFDL